MKLPNTPSRLFGPAARTQSICWLAISMMWPKPITAENASSPVGGANWLVSTAQAKALGLTGASGAVDGYVGLSKSLQYEFNQTATAGKYDAIGVFQHEMTETMGRLGSVGSFLGANTYTAIDLFRYTAPGVRDLTSMGSPDQYLSTDGGQTSLGTVFPSNGKNDFVDFNSETVQDPFGYAFQNAAPAFSGNDATAMTVIGWNLSQQGLALAQTASLTQV